MNDNKMQIQYQSAATGGGYITEVINAPTPQGAFNAIRARLPDAKIMSVTYLPSTPTDQRDGGGNAGRR